MSQNFQPGDFLIFQIESAYGLLRILAIEETGGEKVWHLAAYEEMFPAIESVDAVLEDPSGLTVNKPHLALTNRAFESTQTARMKNVPLTSEELKALEDWKQSEERKVSDLSVRLLLGFR
jgi:hypothetical protein